MLTILIVIALALVVLLIVRLVRGKRKSSLRLHDVGSIIDRSISAYRRNVLPALIVSALCFPLGTFSSYSSSLLSYTTLFVMPEKLLTMSTSLLSSVLLLLGALGIGKTLLACGIAAGMRADQRGEPATLGAFVPRRRLGAAFALSLLMIIPALLAALLGWLGGLIGLLWSLAPVVMIHEEIGPWAATRRSYALARANYSGLLNTLVPLWLIGWLVIGTPMVVVVWALGQLGIAGERLDVVLACGWALGQICVAPLMAFGAASFYRYIRERDAQAAELELRIAAEQPAGGLAAGG